MKNPESGHNPDHFPPYHCQKVDQGSNSLMFQLRCSGVHYLSYGSVTYSFGITGTEATTAATVTITIATNAS